MALESEHSFLEHYSAGAGKTTHFAVASEHTMAWDNKGQRIFRHDIADSPACPGMSCFFRQTGIGALLAEVYFHAGSQNLTREGSEFIKNDGYVRAEIHT